MSYQEDETIAEVGTTESAVHRPNITLPIHPAPVAADAEAGIGLKAQVSNETEEEEMNEIREDIDQVRDLLHKMSFEKLNILRSEMDRLIQGHRNQVIRETRKNLMDLAESLGLPAADLIDKVASRIHPQGDGASGEPTPRATRGPVKVKYRHPDNPLVATWTGRGRKPRWVVEWLEKNNDKTLDDLLA